MRIPKNVLVMHKSEFVNVKGRTDSLAEALHLLIAINDDGQTFDVIKNRYGPNSLDVPVDFLEQFIDHFCTDPEEDWEDDLPF